MSWWLAGSNANMMKLTSIALLAFASLGLSGTSALAQSPLTYSQGDLLLGFRASAGTGADKAYVVNVGPAANYSGATAAFSVSGLGNIAADLSATFGPSWNSRADVFWGVSGTNTNLDLGTVAGEPSRTLFATKGQSSPGVLNSARWQRAVAGTQTVPAGKMVALSNYYRFVNGDLVTVRNSTANSPKGVVQNKTDVNSYASYMPGGTQPNSGTAPGISYAYFNPSIEGNFGAGTSSIIELYRMQPGAGQGDLVGFFSLDDNGSLMFFPASYTGSGGVSGGNATLQFQNATVEVAEGAASATLTIVRGGNLSSALSVTVDTADGSAVSPGDFTAITGQVVNFAANEIQKTVVVDLNTTEVAGFQANRSFTVALSGAPMGVTVQSPATVTIEDTTPAPVGFASATYFHTPKNNLGADQLTFEVTVVRATGKGTASATVGNDASFTAATGHSKLVTPADFTLTGAGALSFAEGETSKTITVNIFTTTKTPGQFRLSLTGVSPSTAIGSTVVTIRKKDTSKPSISITTPGSTVAAPGTFNLTGTVKDDNAFDLGLFEVALNGAPVAVTRDPYAAGVAKAFSATGLQAENGPNTISITARDAQGNVTITNKTFTFVNATLGTANAGTYNAVIVPSGTATNDTSGFVTITVTSTASFSGKVTLSGMAVSISGVLSNAGNARFKPLLGSTFNLIDKTEFESYLGAFSFHVGGGQATGTLLTSASGTPLATFTAERNHYDGVTPATTVPASLLNLPTNKGVYNIALPSEAQVPVLAANLYPQGDGVGTITLTPNGVVAMKGNLADGTAFSASGRLAEDFTVALYSNLYKKRGSLAGKVQFDLLASDSDVSGANLLWIRPAQPRARYYPAGWENGVNVDLVGTQFNPADVNFGQGADLLTTGNASLVFEDGLLSGPVTKGVNVSAANGKVTLIPSSTTEYKLSLSATTGLFSGFFTHSDTTKPAFKGAILNKGANKAGFGYFLSTPPATYGGSGQGGGVSLQP